MDGGAWPFLVGGVICLVNSDNERDSPLLTGAFKRSRRRDFKVRSSRVARSACLCGMSSDESADLLGSVFVPLSSVVFAGDFLLRGVRACSASCAGGFYVVSRVRWRSAFSVLGERIFLEVLTTLQSRKRQRAITGL